MSMNLIIKARTISKEGNEVLGNGEFGVMEGNGSSYYYVVGNGKASASELPKVEISAEAYQQIYEATSYSDAILVQIPQDTSVTPIGHSQLIELQRGGSVDVTYNLELVDENENSSTDTKVYTKNAVDKKINSVLPKNSSDKTLFLSSSNNELKWENPFPELKKGYLFNNGTTLSWEEITSFPAFPSNDSKYYLTYSSTDTGASMSWEQLSSLLPNATSKDVGRIISVDENGKYTLISNSNSIPSFDKTDSTVVLAINGGKYEWSSDYVNKSSGAAISGKMLYSGDFAPDDYSGPMFRNIVISSQPPSTGSDTESITYPNGTIYFQYETSGT